MPNASVPCGILFALKGVKVSGPAEASLHGSIVVVIFEIAPKQRWRAEQTRQSGAHPLEGNGRSYFSDRQRCLDQPRNVLSGMLFTVSVGWVVALPSLQKPPSWPQACSLSQRPAWGNGGLRGGQGVSTESMIERSSPLPEPPEESFSSLMNRNDTATLYATLSTF